MATNKHAIIRYYALDRCFSNAERRYNINDLVDACNKALYKYTGTQEGVHRHQIYNDIVFMEEHWSIPLERHKDGRVSTSDTATCRTPFRTHSSEKTRWTRWHQPSLC